MKVETGTRFRNELASRIVAAIRKAAPHETSKPLVPSDEKGKLRLSRMREFDFLQDTGTPKILEDLQRDVTAVSPLFSVRISSNYEDRADIERTNTPDRPARIGLSLRMSNAPEVRRFQLPTGQFGVLVAAEAAWKANEIVGISVGGGKTLPPPDESPSARAAVRDAFEGLTLHSLDRLLPVPTVINKKVMGETEEAKKLKQARHFVKETSNEITATRLRAMSLTASRPPAIPITYDTVTVTPTQTYDKDIHMFSEIVDGIFLSRLTYIAFLVRTGRLTGDGSLSSYEVQTELSKTLKIDDPALIDALTEWAAGLTPSK